MNAQVNYMMVRQRSAEVQRTGERARLATQVPARRHRLRIQNTITRPSAEPGRGTTAVEIARQLGGAR